MPSRALLIELRLLDGRYHGVGDWPPSPFRLFQALVAGAYGGRWRAEPQEEKDSAFRWLERLAPPIIAAPAKESTRAITYYVPNNDLDAVGGDPRRVSEIRTGKVARPILFDADQPILYAWPFDDEDSAASRICMLANRLHRLGWGIDAAFARAEVVYWNDAELRLTQRGGGVARPVRPGGQQDPTCPVPGSLESLKARYDAGATRFQETKEGRSRVTLFRQPPKPRHRTMAYDRPPSRCLLDLRRADDPAAFLAFPLERATDIAKAIRDVAAARLRHALPARSGEIDRFILGLEAGQPDIARRVRFLPLPSIGHVEADPGIRRVLVEIPQDCPLASDELAWSVSGQDFVDPDTGEIVGIFGSAEDDRMLGHYGIGRQPSLRWRTVTPAAMPLTRRRVRSGSERVEEEANAAGQVAIALRHAGYDWREVDIRIQMEPFRRRGLRADVFRPDRFAGRLRHVEVTFARPVAGPVAIGDGRWLGLGLMEPVRTSAPTVHVFAISAGTTVTLSQREAVVRALRRAVMALVEAERARRRTREGGTLPRAERLPTFFTGHELDGAPARGGHHDHLFFLADDCDGDGRIDRLSIVASERADRTVTLVPEKRREVQRHLRLLDRALTNFKILRAGPAGVLELLHIAGQPEERDRTFGRSKRWISDTPYSLTRHAHRASVEDAVRSDLVAECERRGLPRPEVEVLGVETGPRGRLSARARLRFNTAVAGPLVLGRGSHFGGGLFRKDY